MKYIIDTYKIPIFLSVIGILTFLYCTAPSLLRLNEDKGIPGVDPVVVRQMWNEARHLLIDPKAVDDANREKKKGRHMFSLFKILQELTTELETYQNDAGISIRIAGLEDYPKIKGRILEAIRKKRIDMAKEIIDRERLKSLARAKHAFQKSYKANPYDVDLICYLAQTTMQLAADTEDPEIKNRFHEFANKILMNALTIDKGGHDIYYYLAENFRLSGEWFQANFSYQNGLNILQMYDFLPENPLSDTFEAHIDSPMIFTYLYRIGESFAKLYQADFARDSFNEALNFTQSLNEIESVSDYIQWIDWAEGDIRAREIFEDAHKLETETDYPAAAEKYLEVITRTIDKKNAFWETSWRLSKIEYEYLYNDSAYCHRVGIDNMGLDRLRNIINKIPKNELGLPNEPIYLNYMNDFAVMLFNRANSELSLEGRRQAAENLFAECATLHSEIQAKSCLKMTRLYQNARILGFLWALKTFTLVGQLSREELVELSILFKRVTRRPRNPALIQFFNEQFQFLIDNETPTLDRKTLAMAYEYLRSAHIALDNYLWKNFQRHHDPIFTKEYARKYLEKEKQLSPSVRKKMRDEITAFYYQNFYHDPEERHIYKEWRTHLRTLK